MYRWVARHAERSPDRLAVLDADSGDRWTFAELDVWVRELGRSLEAEGVGPGMRVGTLLDRSPVYIATLWAILRRGATLVPLDTAEPAETVRKHCEQVDIDHLVHTRSYAGTAAEAVPESERRTQIDDLETLEADHSETSRTETPGCGSRSYGDVPTIDPDRTRLLLFTSGTAGDPKAVRLTRRNIGSSAAGSAYRLGVDRDDRWFLTLPLYHMGGLSIPLRAGMYGTAVVVERSFEPAKTAERMAATDSTGVSLVPTMLDRLLVAGWQPQNLRFALIGGAPTPTELVNRALDAGVPIHTTYGMTETASQVATAVPGELRTNPETVGRPLKTANVHISDNVGSTNRDPMEGEILVSGPIVSPGYLDADRPADEPFRTGDIGYLDENRRLFVTGRESDMIVTGGENVHPATVEAAFENLQEVADVTVVGLPDEEWGERVAALVVPEGNPTPSNLESAVAERLPHYAVPKTIQFVSSIPRTHSGTVDREAVRDMLQDAEAS